jgi:Protein of unknown function (DUF1439)
MRTHLYLIPFLAPLLAACLGVNDGKLTLDFSASQIQERIAPKFPVEKCPLPFTCIKLQNPKANLLGNSERLQLGFDTTVSVPQQPVAGTSVVSAKLRFNAANGEIYLDEPRVESFALDGVPPAITALVAEHGGKLLAASLQNTAVYTFKNAQLDKLAKMAITDVKVVDGKLRVVLDPAVNPFGDATKK